MIPAGDADTSADEPARPPRRLLLTAGAGLCVAFTTMVTGCDSWISEGGSGDADPPAEPPRDPDESIRSALVAGSTELIQVYGDTIEAYPKLRAVLKPYERRHRQHLKGFEAGLTVPPTPTGTRTPTTTPTPTPTPDDVPPTEQEAVSALLDAERAVASKRAAGLGEIADPELARLVASVIACGRAHTSQLADVDPRGGS